MRTVGGLAILRAVASQLLGRGARPPWECLRPIAFASLLGGSATLIGTAPNILIASVRRDLVGAPFTMFDFTPVGAGVTICGVAFLAFGWRLIPRGLRGRTAEPALAIEDYQSELRVGKASAYVGRTVGDIEELSGGAVAVTAIIRDEHHRYVPAASWPLHPEDVLVVEADPQAIEQFARDGNLGNAWGGGSVNPTIQRALPATASLVAARASSSTCTRSPPPARSGPAVPRRRPSSRVGAWCSCARPASTNGCCWKTCAMPACTTTSRSTTIPTPIGACGRTRNSSRSRLSST